MSKIGFLELLGVFLLLKVTVSYPSFLILLGLANGTIPAYSPLDTCLSVGMLALAR